MATVAWSWWLLLVAGAFVGAWLGTGVILDYCRRTGIVDRPDARSLHSDPTPRGGGMAIAIVFAGSGLLLSWWVGGDGAGAIVALVVATSVVAATGWIEDARGLGVGWRLALEIAAAAGLLLMIGPPGDVDLFGALIPLGPLAWPLWLLWLAGLTNLYNFMDGVDGIAAGQAVVAGAGFGTWFAAAGAPGMALLCWCLAAASAGFLRWNWAPARIFMGDSGSLALGFVFGAIALIGAGRHEIPIGAFVLGLGLFLADSTWTLVKRMVRRERWWQPHRSHFYQRAYATGWSHRRIAGTVVAVGVVLMGLGTLEALRSGPRWLWPLLSAAVILGSAGLIRGREGASSSGPPGSDSGRSRPPSAR